MDYTQNTYKCAVRATVVHLGNRVKVARVRNLAKTLVWQEYTSSEAKGAYGQILVDKPDNVAHMMYKNFSNLSIFADGPRKHKKIHQLNKLASDYGVDLLSGCETRTDWWFSRMKRAGMDNLLGDCVPSILMMERSNGTIGGGPA